MAMTKEEAIECLKSFKTVDTEDICSKCKYINNCNPDEAINMAIIALEKSIQYDIIKKVLCDIAIDDHEIDFINPPEPTVPISCKDCKWFGKAGCAIEVVDDSDKPKEDDFCSFAERKEEK